MTMLTDDKITGYRGIGLLYSFEGVDVAVIAGNVETLRNVMKTFGAKQPLDREKCKNVVVISSAALKK